MSGRDDKEKAPADAGACVVLNLSDCNTDGSAGAFVRNVAGLIEEDPKVILSLLVHKHELGEAPDVVERVEIAWSPREIVHILKAAAKLFDSHDRVSAAAENLSEVKDEVIDALKPMAERGAREKAARIKGARKKLASDPKQEAMQIARALFATWQDPRQKWPLSEVRPRGATNWALQVAQETGLSFTHLQNKVPQFRREWRERKDNQAS